MAIVKSRHRAFLFPLGIILGATGFAPAQPMGLEKFSAGSPELPKITVVKMTLHAAAAPVPAMKHYLLPEVRDLKPGNAALLYQRAHSQEWWSNFIRNREVEKMGELLELPMRKMPRDKIVLLHGALKEIDLAARREYCDWELTPRLREEGYYLVLPDVQGFRVYAQMLALRVRVDMLNDHLDQAVVDLQTGFALGRHVGEAPILINALVGIAISNVMLAQVEELVQQEKAPNLYWALADLPKPFIDLRRPLQGEKVGFDGMFADLRAALKDPKHPPIPIATLNKYLDNLRAVGGFVDENLASNRLILTMMAARVYPAAKKHLLASGFPAENVDVMPITQVSLMYALVLYDEAYDDTYKWESFPYWHAKPGMAKARQRFHQMLQDQPEATLLAKLLFPALDKVMFAKARLQRRIAMLEVVEALRLHAAGQGKLPNRLEDVRDVPLPVDPITGKAFEYTVEDNRAILYAPPPAGEMANEQNAVRYELTLAAKK